MKTRARILEVARRLFNEQGEAHTTNQQVAAAAGIAVGNLWYHFRTRDDLRAALSLAAARDYRAALAQADGPAPATERYVRYTLGTMRAMWDHRFLTEDAAARRASAGSGLMREQYGRLRALLDELAGEGAFASGPADVDDLAPALWMVVRHWPDHLREIEGVAAPTPGQWRRGFDLKLAILNRIMTPASFAELQACVAALDVARLDATS
ncbi:TetR/AcrR family transcriptional regulator [Phenylobacterium sp.]|uniref:TetR/AcrR family transcriptional regulator n=1 Tax=Phenylobacterium sp. TaxID=1871053 RepID=UPI00301DDCF2